MRLGFLIILMVFFFIPACFAGTGVKKGVKRGNLLYNKGKFEEALEEYKRSFEHLPDSDIVNFNLGAALYKTGNYDRAIGHFKRSLLTEDESLGQKANYNLGNTEYKAGIAKEDSDLKGAVGLLEQALHHYKRAIEFDSEDEDAKYNYEFVKKELERLKKKLKQKQQQKPEQDKKIESEKEKKDTQQQSEQEEKQEKEESPERESQKQREEQLSEEVKEQGAQPGSEPEEAETEGEQDSSQSSDSRQQEGEMTEKEALMLLEDYRQAEEPKGLYKEKIPKRRFPAVLKDW